MMFYLFSHFVVLSSLLCPFLSFYQSFLKHTSSLTRIAEGFINEILSTPRTIISNLTFNSGEHYHQLATSRYASCGKAHNNGLLTCYDLSFRLRAQTSLLFSIYLDILYLSALCCVPSCVATICLFLTCAGVRVRAHAHTQTK